MISIFNTRQNVHNRPISWIAWLRVPFPYLTVSFQHSRKCQPPQCDATPLQSRDDDTAHACMTSYKHHVLGTSVELEQLRCVTINDNARRIAVGRVCQWYKCKVEGDKIVSPKPKSRGESFYKIWKYFTQMNQLKA